MSFDDDFAADALVDIYDTFGVDGTVQRGAAAPEPVRIIVDRDQERLGEYGQVIGRIDKVRCMIGQWTLQQGDVVAWTDRLGTHSKTVETQADDDGLESVGVLHG
ncbi:hypothetical protein [Marilutibacter alkalisoli]|uniref:Uncharacterized protein n=1 Tax=Marilutibacter alkalisoli TaxID=2591633 RepID=A0A514BTV9_9GAMM|nr:hypothetical protein [Lysobacter alkalisoli]QDH70848.1 hypothetical protein FKV23_12715 [Lysobacter alkalisoli]